MEMYDITLHGYVHFWLYLRGDWGGAHSPGAALMSVHKWDIRFY